MIDNSLLEDIVQYFAEGDGKHLNVTSLFFEEMNRRDIGQVVNKVRHAHGAEYITDVILGLRFRISDASFFQINTKAAEFPYKSMFTRIKSKIAHSFLVIVTIILCR